MKRYIKRILYSTPVARLNVKFRLFILQKAYEGLGRYASILEGGVHPKHRLMNYHRFFLDNVEPDDVVLDLGCGNGLVALDVAQKAKEVLGLDINESNIKAAKENERNLQRRNITFIVGDATKIEFDKKFDKIILSNVLEHIELRIEFLKKIGNLLRDAPSAALLLRVPMLNRDWVTLYKKELDMEYRLDRTHYIEYTVETLTEEIGRSGWHISEYSIQFGEIWAIVQKST